VIRVIDDEESAFMQLVFWGALIVVVYSYLLYPALLALLVRYAPALRPLPGRADAPSARPNVACIVAAFNEERHIDARIDNFFAQSYDHNCLRVYVGSDGSRDRTSQIVMARASAQLRAFAFEHNRGKASVLNDLVAATDEPILVFSDANTLFQPDAIERLVAHFADPRVGVVCGELKLLAANGNNQDSVYWRIEQFLKLKEARLGGLLGANGAIYALRRELYRPLKPDTITDDFCIAMTAAAEGWTLVYDPKAIAVEDTPDGIADEYRRRVRIGIGNYQALFRHPEYLLSTNWATRFAYVSHKILRWLTPHLLVAAFVASAILAQESPFYWLLFILQLVGYGFGAIVLVFRLDRFLPRFAATLVFFLALNWAFLVAFLRYITGRYSGSWRATARGPALSSPPAN
jgi:cellulose synthase/poly-beta-1,6-N-acetylglucosamine synthase-like glycosyltransferase